MEQLVRRLYFDAKKTGFAKTFEQLSEQELKANEASATSMYLYAEQASKAAREDNMARQLNLEIIYKIHNRQGVKEEQVIAPAREKQHGGRKADALTEEVNFWKDQSNLREQYQLERAYVMKRMRAEPLGKLRMRTAAIMAHDEAMGALQNVVYRTGGVGGVILQEERDEDPTKFRRRLVLLRRFVKWRDLKFRRLQRTMNPDLVARLRRQAFRGA